MKVSCGMPTPAAAAAAAAAAAGMELTCAVALIVSADGRLLRILPRKHLPRPKLRGRGMTKGLAAPWDAPGGKLRANETALAAMMREVSEEAGIDLRGTTPTAQHIIPESRCAVFVL